MHQRDLTPVELADLLDAAYRQDRGLGGEGLGLPERVELADFLGCHPDVQAKAWLAWQELIAEGGDMEEGEPQYWLDVEFVEPCPEHNSTSPALSGFCHKIRRTVRDDQIR
ncbi:hypothetical protein ACFFLM_00550 [Deinococcus oregonensis]|uniref:Uncharacterized protein n=1 Tax=Deinococcus oregonensis TaxID=1805970 RepID=A0ABV6ASK5_9DEIO